MHHTHHHKSPYKHTNIQTHEHVRTNRCGGRKCGLHSPNRVIAHHKPWKISSPSIWLLVSRYNFHQCVGLVDHWTRLLLATTNAGR